MGPSTLHCSLPDDVIFFQQTTCQSLLSLANASNAAIFICAVSHGIDYVRGERTDELQLFGYHGTVLLNILLLFCCRPHGTFEQHRYLDDFMRNHNSTLNSTRSQNVLRLHYIFSNASSFLKIFWKYKPRCKTQAESELIQCRLRLGITLSSLWSIARRCDVYIRHGMCMVTLV